MKLFGIVWKFIVMFFAYSAVVGRLAAERDVEQEERDAEQEDYEEDEFQNERGY